MRIREQSINTKDGSNRNSGIEVGGAVNGITHDGILAITVKDNDLLLFFGGQNFNPI